MSSPMLEMNNKLKIPQMGFGVFLIWGDEDTERCCLEALKLGYRHIDTAHVYRNERGVGQAIKKSGIPREEIFLTSKLWHNECGEGVTSQAIDRMLKRLDVSYIDLLLIVLKMSRGNEIKIFLFPLNNIRKVNSLAYRGLLWSLERYGKGSARRKSKMHWIIKFYGKTS